MQQLVPPPEFNLFQLLRPHNFQVESRGTIQAELATYKTVPHSLPAR